MSLREAHVELIDCDHRTPPPAATGYPYVTIPDLRDGRIEVSNTRRITAEHYRQWTRRAKPQAYDVILSRRTNPGVTAFVPSDLEFALGQNLVLLRTDGSVIDHRFLRWLVRGPDWWAQIQRHLNVGAVFDSLKCADIPNFRLPIPPLSEQRRIAELLTALDDKIELNRRMSQTYELMARTVFKSWCIDSDSHFDQAGSSEPREVTSGWKRVSLGDLVDVARDVVDPARWPDRVFSHYSIPAFDQGRRPTTELGREIGSIKFQVAPGSALLSKLNPRIPRVWLVDEEPSPNPVASTEFMILRPRHPATTAYLYCLAQSSGFRSDLEALATGTSGSHQRAQRDAVLALQVTIPPPTQIDSFDGLVRPVLRRVARCQLSAAAIVAIREALLPTLLRDHMAELAGRSPGS
jgi:hypothetical protein